MYIAFYFHSFTSIQSIQLGSFLRKCIQSNLKLLVTSRISIIFLLHFMFFQSCCKFLAVSRIIWPEFKELQLERRVRLIILRKRLSWFFSSLDEILIFSLFRRFKLRWESLKGILWACIEDTWREEKDRLEANWLGSRQKGMVRCVRSNWTRWNAEKLWMPRFFFRSIPTSCIERERG